MEDFEKYPKQDPLWSHHSDYMNTIEFQPQDKEGLTCASAREGEAEVASCSFLVGRKEPIIIRQRMGIFIFSLVEGEQVRGSLWVCTKIFIAA